MHDIQYDVNISSSVIGKEEEWPSQFTTPPNKKAPPTCSRTGGNDVLPSNMKTKQTVTEQNHQTFWVKKIKKVQNRKTLKPIWKTRRLCLR